VVLVNALVEWSDFLGRAFPRVVGYRRRRSLSNTSPQQPLALPGWLGRLRCPALTLAEGMPR